MGITIDSYRALPIIVEGIDNISLGGNTTIDLHGIAEGCRKDIHNNDLDGNSYRDSCQ